MVPSLPPSKENCWEQYVRLFYLLTPKTIASEHRRKIWSSIGPVALDDWVNTARYSKMLNHVVEMSDIRGKHQDACGLAAKVGLVEEAHSLLRLHGSMLPDLELAKVVNYVYAPQLLTGQREKMTSSESADEKISALESQWHGIAKSFDMFCQRGKIPNIDFTQNRVLNDFLTLLVSATLSKGHWRT